MTGKRKKLQVLFILIGAVGMLLTSAYTGWQSDFVHSYGTSVTATFSIYFLLIYA